MAAASNFDTLKQRLPLNEDAMTLLHSLPKKEREKLCANVLSAEKEQGERVDQAIEGAVRFVPAPLRRRVRKLLFD